MCLLLATGEAVAVIEDIVVVVDGLFGLLVFGRGGGLLALRGANVGGVEDCDGKDGAIGNLWCDGGCGEWGNKGEDRDEVNLRLLGFGESDEGD